MRTAGLSKRGVRGERYAERKQNDQQPARFEPSSRVVEPCAQRHRKHGSIVNHTGQKRNEVAASPKTKMRSGSGRGLFDGDRFGPGSRAAPRPTPAAPRCGTPASAAAQFLESAPATPAPGE